MKNKKIKLDIIIISLLLLWIPVTIDKIINFESFKAGILRQPISETFQFLAMYTLPLAELITAILLISKKFQRSGLILSIILMSVFTSYVAFALIGAFGKIPCSCGSIISSFNWQQHLWFNIIFLCLSGLGLILNTGLDDRINLIKRIKL